VSLTAEQIAQLLRPINPKRVLRAEGQTHVSQQDIRAHLTRIFGFEGWDKEILELRCVRDEIVTVPAKNGKPERQVPAVTYLCRMRLTVRDPAGNVVKVSEDVGTGTSPNLPTVGDAHDFAAKNAVSYALKRCATDLGDQFGLSLYNKGQTAALVGRTLVTPGEDEPAGDVEADVPQQESMGDVEGGAAAADEIARDVRTGTVSPSEADQVRAEIRRLCAERGWNPVTVAQGYTKEYPGRTGKTETDPEPLALFLQNLLLDAQREDEAKAGAA
jgi:hypothetical protein